jgi:hypothetical protein
MKRPVDDRKPPRRELLDPVGREATASITARSRAGANRQCMQSQTHRQIMTRCGKSRRRRPPVRWFRYPCASIEMSFHFSQVSIRLA